MRQEKPKDTDVILQDGLCPVTDRGGHLPPLQHRILGDAAVRVDVDALVFVANQNLGSGFVWQNDDGVRMD